MNLSVIQVDERCFSRKDDYDYSNCKFILAQIKKNGDDFDLEYMGGAMGDNRDTWKEYLNLPKGEYFVFVEFDWHEKANMFEFCLTGYG